MNELTLNILGFPAVNRDLQVEIRDPDTQKIVQTVKPFLDGTVKVPKINPGAYEIAVKHPNLALPVLTRPIRVLPSGPTKVSVVIDPSRFRNTPIEDIPDANLTPVGDLAASVEETLKPLTDKKPGQAILASDWNVLAGSVRDLARAVSELTKLVSPTGHNHPEIEKKLGEMNDNFRSLLDTLSASLTELQREIQLDNLRDHITSVLDKGNINPNTAEGKELLDIVEQVRPQIQANPEIFGKVVRNAGVQIETKLEQLVEKKKDDTAFVTSPEVKQLQDTTDVVKKQRASSYESELQLQRTLNRTVFTKISGR